jgi:hypothetical protein
MAKAGGALFFLFFAVPIKERKIAINCNRHKHEHIHIGIVNKVRGKLTSSFEAENSHYKTANTVSRI